MNVSMTVHQVKAARRRVWAGEAVKEVAADMKLPYGAVYNAVTGRTWSSIANPPPLLPGTLNDRRKKMHTCGNCGEQYRSDDRRKRGTVDRCKPCYAHLQRHGTERKLEHVRQRQYARLSAKQLARLYGQYAAGASMREVLERNQLPFSEETLRRRFISAGFALRDRSETKVKLTPGLVRQARELVYREGVPISDLARRYGVKYQTLHTAVIGNTWRAAGGPLPETEGEKKPCKHCKLLTGHPSGLCRYCR